MNPMPYPETIDAKEPTLFGYPIQITLKITDKETVDITHVLQWDGTQVTLDMAAIADAVMPSPQDEKGTSHQMTEQAWICPTCGQWGATEFGRHRLPDRDIWDGETCDDQPVHITIGPFLRRYDQRRTQKESR